MEWDPSLERIWVLGMRRETLPFAWPGSRFTTVKSIRALEVTKLYAKCDGNPVAVVSTPNGALSLRWQKLDLGLWLDYGGWPTDHPVHQVAIEPTTASFDSLCQERASWLKPNEIVQWKITFHFREN